MSVILKYRGTETRLLIFFSKYQFFKLLFSKQGLQMPLGKTKIVCTKERKREREKDIRAPLCWKSNNPRAQAPWRNYLPYESMAKSKCLWQNRIALTFRRFLQINPEKMTSLQMCRIKKITPCSIQTFWDRQLCFYVKKLFVSEKTQKSELFHFS